MHWKRWLGIGIVAVAVVLAIIYGYQPQPVLVEAGTVKHGLLRVTVDEEGQTRVTDRFVVSAPVAGYARRVGLNVGDAISRGRVVTQIEPMRSVALDPRSRAQAEARVSTAEAAVQQARERIETAKVNVGHWEGERARVQALYESNDVPRQQYDQTVTQSRLAEAELRAARQGVEVATSELEAARVALGDFTSSEPAGNGAEVVTVRSPVSGRVLQVVRKSEGVVNPGDPLVEIANAQSLEVIVDVLSADAVRIEPGSRVLFERWGGDQPLEGRVRLIEPVAFTKVSALGVEEQRVQVVADITSPRELWEKLGDGYRVEASFILWEGADVLQVPSSALFRYGEGWAVFTLEAVIARRREVEIGHRNGLEAEVLSGLAEGDVVLTHPDDTVEDGTLVTVRED